MAQNIKIISLLNGIDLLAEVVTTTQYNALAQCIPVAGGAGGVGPAGSAGGASGFSSIITTDVVVRNPIRIIVIPGKADVNKPSVGFAPWVPAQFTSDKDISISKTQIITMVTPLQDFINQYNSMFGGIVAPSAQLIIPGI